MKRAPHRIWLPLLALPFLLLSATAGAGTWKGSEEVVDGVLHIENPAEPIDPPMTITLEEDFRLGGWDGGDDEFFGLIADIMEDEEGNLYVLDAQLNEIKIYDRSGELVNTIGREGEGPGEFRRASNLFWMPNGDIGVIQTFPARVVTLARDGTPGEDFQLDALEGDGFRVLIGAERAGDHLAVIYATNKFDQEKMTFEQANVLALFDAEGHELAKLHEASSRMNFAAPKITEIQWDTFRNRWTVGPDGRVYTVPALSDYAIKVWNPDGSVSRVIEREYEPYPRNAEQKEEILELYKGFTRGQQLPPNTTYEIEDHFPAIAWQGVYTRPDGSLWVRSSRGDEGVGDDSLGTFDVFDPKGRFLRQATLLGQCDNDNDGVRFVGDRIFVITEFITSAMAAQGGGPQASGDEEEEAEPMALICYHSSQLDAAASIPAAPADSR